MRKPWYMSKTIWSGVLLMAGAVGYLLYGDPDKAFELFLIGSGLLGLRQAID